MGKEERAQGVAVRLLLLPPLAHFLFSHFSQETITMAHPEPTSTTNLNRYGDEAMPWDGVLDALTATYPDPPVEGSQRSPCWAQCARWSSARGCRWRDLDRGSLVHRERAPHQEVTQPGANPACTLTASCKGWTSCSRARPASDGSRRTRRVAKVYRDNGWPAEVEGDAFIAPYMAQSGGPPPWNLYRLELEEAVAVGTSKDRWR